MLSLLSRLAATLLLTIAPSQIDISISDTSSPCVDHLRHLPAYTNGVVLLSNVTELQDFMICYECQHYFCGKHFTKNRQETTMGMDHIEQQHDCNVKNSHTPTPSEECLCLKFFELEMVVCLFFNAHPFLFSFRSN